MVVVPTSNEVVIEFRNTWAENLGMAISVVTLIGLGIFAWSRFRRQRTGLRPE
jgi:predicted negative regulator of RcsB-dependent stress response